MTTNKSPSLSYRPDIDGLRCIAVVPVLLFHAGLGFTGGYVGVDIFFVISGFLITSIIAKDIREQKFSMLHFWERRIRRIIPAAAVVVFCTLVAGAFILLPQQFIDLGSSAAAQTMMAANFYFWDQSGYFAPSAEFAPLLHTWSLAVEEQFYFILPLLLVFAMGRKRTSSGTAIKLLGTIFVLSFLWSIHSTRTTPDSAFFLLPARAWELLTGSLLALAGTSRTCGPRLNEILSAIGIGLIGFAVFYYDHATPFPGLAAVPPCLGTALLLFSNQNKPTFCGRILALPPLVFIGKISYSLYLWHWPLLVYARHLAIDETSLTVRISMVVISIVLATLTWKFVENPFRGKSTLKNRNQVFSFFFVTTACLLLMASVVISTNGFPSRLSQQAQTYAKAGQEELPIQQTRAVTKEGTLPTVNPADNGTPVLPVLVWSDSHGRVLAPMFRKLCDQHQVNIYIATRDSHVPLLDVSLEPMLKNAAEYNDAVFKFIQENKIRTVVLVSRWRAYIEETPNHALMRQRGATEEDDSSAKDVFQSHMASTVARLREAGVEVWIMKQVPYHDRHPHESLARAVMLDRDIATLGSTIAEHKKRQAFVNSVIDAQASEQVHIIDPLPVFEMENQHYRLQKDGKSLYRDDDHLSDYGSTLLAPIFEPMFKSIVEQHRPRH
ncbi:O-antigen acetylase [Oceaniferula spumae]|uniref:O-antigen acetylase n=1 Tax=Oceaniferula spumae TaxID=2979115 RepID=A0AAT9FQG9_9BACT